MLAGLPATVAIVAARLKVRLERAEIELIARGGRSFAKASRRDIALVAARGETRATTVAATMFAAVRAGIASARSHRRSKRRACSGWRATR